LLRNILEDKVKGKPIRGGKILSLYMIIDKKTHEKVSRGAENKKKWAKVRKKLLATAEDYN